MDGQTDRVTTLCFQLPVWPAGGITSQCWVADYIFLKE